MKNLYWNACGIANGDTKRALKNLVLLHKRIFFNGCPQYILASKLWALKVMLKEWNCSHVGDVHSRVADSKAVLDEVQAEISSQGPSEDRFQHECLAHTKYLFDLFLQSTILKDKSRIRWLSDRDRNTSFLHNMVHFLMIAAHFVQHYEHSFAQNSAITDTGLVERVIPHMVTDVENASLMTIPYPQEVHEAVKRLDGFSAPGPDGFGGCFFSHYWDVVSNDVTLAV
ncbi:hypothetical protein M0R45_008855 [Rubus argutus]|uniref:Uncharacterized protein n=1 Tax=Rubus argutus TaxID=59490 RepID=A0AAW1Y453_RUBAR